MCSAPMLSGRGMGIGEVQEEKQEEKEEEKEEGRKNWVWEVSIN